MQRGEDGGDERAVAAASDDDGTRGPLGTRRGGAATGGVYGSINAAWVVNPQVKEQTGPMFRMTANIIKSHAALMGTQTATARMATARSDDRAA